VVSAPADNDTRFDGESARAILERAAAEQQRQNSALAGSYSLDELTEMAAEAGISPEALETAIEAHARERRATHQGPRFVSRKQSRGGPSVLDRLVPGPWPRAVKGVVLATAGGIGVVGLALAFPAVAQMALWALVAFLLLVTLLIALGASPF
jgi:hypothetical protein